MSTRILLPAHATIDAPTAASLAIDPNFGLTSVPTDVRRGLLELGAPNARQLASFWPDGDRSYRAPAGDEQLAVEWATFAAVSPRATTLEIAVGLLGHHDPHWRLIDVTQMGGRDIRTLTASERYAALLDLYRATLHGERSLRLVRQEFALLVNDAKGKSSYAAEGPGRAGDRLAFRRLAAPYGEAWLLAPVGWTSGARTR